MQEEYGRGQAKATPITPSKPAANAADKKLCCLTSPSQPRAGAAEMQSPPPSISSHIVVARRHHHPHPRRSLIVDCCFCRPRPCHCRWCRCLLLPMASLRPATAAKDDSAKACQGGRGGRIIVVVVVMFTSSPSPPPLAPPPSFSNTHRSLPLRHHLFLPPFVWLIVVLG